MAAEAEAEPDFKHGDLVRSTSGYFQGVGEVIGVMATRHGWFVKVAHQGGAGEVISLCDPKKITKAEGTV